MDSEILGSDLQERENDLWVEEKWPESGQRALPRAIVNLSSRSVHDPQPAPIQTAGPGVGQGRLSRALDVGVFGTGLIQLAVEVLVQLA